VIATTAGALPGCTVVRGAPATPIAGVEMDSRLAGRGSLFVAIRGGHAHTADARAQGCAAVLVEDDRAAVETEGVVLTAPDTIAALQRIGAANRAASAATVVGVTGSSGKTSTKDVLAALVGAERRTIAAAEGHNNEIGLPFTLTRIAADTEVAVCEMSMRGPGQITELAELARPEIGVITNVGEAHLELLGSREAIAAAKAELLAHVEVAVVNRFHPSLLVRSLQLSGAVPMSFGGPRMPKAELAIDFRPANTSAAALPGPARGRLASSSSANSWSASRTPPGKRPPITGPTLLTTMFTSSGVVLTTWLVSIGRLIFCRWRTTGRLPRRR